MAISDSKSEEERARWQLFTPLHSQQEKEDICFGHQVNMICTFDYKSHPISLHLTQMNINCNLRLGKPTAVHVTLFTEKKNGAKMAPPWSRFGKRFHFLKVEPFFFLIIMFEKTVPLCKVVLKRYLNGAILWTWKRLHPGAISAPLFSFSVSSILLHYHKNVVSWPLDQMLKKLPFIRRSRLSLGSTFSKCAQSFYLEMENPSQQL